VSLPHSVQATFGRRQLPHVGHSGSPSTNRPALPENGRSHAPQVLVVGAATFMAARSPP
jgi:hypothetical protein